MFNNEKIRPYILLFLAFCVLVSKQILIFNEETLVALSFLAFVIFVFYYFGNTITNSLNERSQVILHELQNFFSLKQEAIRHLLSEHNKVLELTKTLSILENFTTQEWYNSSAVAKKAFLHNLTQQIQQKLQTLISTKNSLQNFLQPLMAANLFSYVLVKYLRAKKQKNYAKLLNFKKVTNAIRSLSKAN